MKRVSIWLGGSVFLIVLLALGVWLYVGRTGTTRLEAWIGQYLTTVLEGYITPRVILGDLDYQAPRTVVVTNVSLQTEREAILSIGRMRLELAEVPKRGEPILIQEIILDDPKLVFQAAPEGGFAGWNDFVRPEIVKDQVEVPEGRRLSDVLVLRHAAVHGGELVYRDPEGEAMRLPGLNFDLRTEPAGEEPGWYTLAATLERAPLLKAVLDARVNLDTALLEVAKLQMDARIGPQQYDSVPPQLQGFLREHDVRGELRLALSGSLPLEQLERSAGDVEAALHNGRFRYGDDLVPIERVEVAARLPDGGITLTLSNVAWESRGRTVLKLPEVMVRAAGLPAAGQPLRVEQVTFRSPHVALIDAVAGGLVGWDRLADDDQDELDEWEATAAPDPFLAATAPAVTTEPATPPITDFVIVENIDVEDASFEYDFGDPAGPLLVTDIDVALHGGLEAAGGDWYAIEGRAERKPLLTADFASRFNFATNVLQIERLTAEASLSEERYGELPEQAQAALRKLAPHGELSLSAAGTVPLNDPAATEGEAQVQLRQAGLHLSNMMVHVAEAGVTAALPNQGIDLTAADFELGAEETTLLSIGGVSAHIAGIPRPGAPLQVGRITIDTPRVQVVAAADGGLAGWRQLADPVQDAQPADQREPRRRARPPLTSQIRVDALELKDGEIAYQPAPDTEPLFIEGLHAVLQSDVQSPGWYSIDGMIEREPVLRGTFAGRFNPDEKSLELTESQFAAIFDQASYEALPQRMAASLQRYALAGQVQASVQGLIPLDDPLQAEGSAEVSVQGARFSYTGLTSAIEKLHISARFPQGPLTANAGGVTLRDGEQPLLSMRAFSAELTDLPRGASDFHVKQLSIDSPDIVLMQQADGGFAGWNRLMPAQDVEAADRAPQGESTGAELPFAALPVDDVEITNAAVTYSSPDIEPVTFEGLDFALQTAQTDEPGWQGVAAQLRSAPILDLRLEGRLHAHEAVLALDPLTVDISLTPEAYETLPPRMQETLRRHGMRGVVHARCRGRLPLRAPSDAAGMLELEVNDAQLAYRDLRWTLAQVSLTADAPDGPLRVQGQNLSVQIPQEDLLSIRRLALEMPRLPLTGRLFEIDRLELGAPRLVLAQNAAGEFVGWANLLGDEDEVQAEQGAETGPALARDGPPLYERLLLHELTIDDGELVYLDIEDQETMVLPGIMATLRMPPVEGRDGWYAVSGEVKRPPLIDIAVEGRVHMPENVLELDELVVNVKLDEEQYENLPPQLQQTLRAHQVRGQLHAEAEGQFPLRNLPAAQGSAAVNLQRAHVALDKTEWPIAELLLDATVEDGTAFGQLDASMLGGRIQAEGTLALRENQPLSLSWDINGVRIERAMLAAKQESKFAGNLKSNGQLSAQLGQLPDSISGTGSIHVAEGRLMNLPVLEDLLRAIKKAPLQLDLRPNDRGQASFQLLGNRAEITEAEVVSAVAAMRGKGDIYYDGRLDLVVSAGVLEKLQERLGAIGQLLGRLQDKVVTYRVTGTVEEPKIGVRAGGVDFGAK